MSPYSATILSVLEAAAGYVPRSFALAAGRGLGNLSSFLVRSRRKQVLANLELAYGMEMNHLQRRRLMHQVFRHFGRALVEEVLMPQMVAHGLDRYVDYEGWENLEQSVAGGKGAIIFTGHFGNWELIALAQGARGIPMDVVGRPPDSLEVARRLDRLRKLTGNRTISKRHAVRPMLQSLREGRTVGLVIDQNVGAGRGVFVNFFGHQASTTPALAVLALKTGVPVLPVFSYPNGTRYQVVYRRPLQFHPSGRRQEDILSLTQEATKVIEEEIRLRPHLWLWMHNRWRSRPENEMNPPLASSPEAPEPIKNAASGERPT
ncbi:MAG: lysophospholipid acyltransferase family protein [Acidobacteriota bacterium]